MVLSGDHQCLGLAVSSVGEGWRVVGHEAAQVDKVTSLRAKDASLRDLDFILRSNGSEREGLHVRKLILAAVWRMAGGAKGEAHR